MKLIDKDKVIAELERLIAFSQNMGDNAINGSMQQFYDGMKEGCTKALSAIQSIETGVKEVDLEIEFDRYCENLYATDIQEEPFTRMYDCAKHFFELGLKARKGE